MYVYICVCTQEVDWMSESTRGNAMKKMDKFSVKIGFPVQYQYQYSTRQAIYEKHV
jgi:predicted metalloendopeptidase